MPCLMVSTIHLFFNSLYLIVLDILDSETKIKRLEGQYITNLLCDISKNLSEVYWYKAYELPVIHPRGRLEGWFLGFDKHLEVSKPQKPKIKTEFTNV